MKTPKIKRYRLGVSRYFPTTHPRKGEPTYFVDKIDNAIGSTESCNVIIHKFEGNVSILPKIHTIRGNYELWYKRMAEVQAGRAVIELFYWSGKPYHKDENGIGQVVFATLDKDSGCGVQELEFYSDGDGHFSIMNPTVTGSYDIDVNELCKNDGLSFQDFYDWFDGYDLSKPMAIIHFTSFRY
jgi:hypothetical protein